MINSSLKYLLATLFLLTAGRALAQYSGTTGSSGTTTGRERNLMRDTSTAPKQLTDDQMLDTLRKAEEKRKDSVIFTSKFIRVTTEKLLNDSTQLFALDTTLTNFENYSALYQPRHPYIGLGNLGLDARELLFTPSKTIGFDVGLHTLDAYLLHPADILYYRARVPITSLYLVSSGLIEQVFKVMHTQNIKPNWNIGLNFNRIGSNGEYARQHADHLSAAFFSWYESKDKRYNVLGNLFFNNLKTPESGAITNDSIYTSSNVSLLKTGETVRLNNSRINWRDNGFYLKQFYYLGRIDSTSTASGASNILPTQRLAYTFFYNTRKYKFYQDDQDTYNVFPNTYFEKSTSRDSLSVLHFQNEFSYSFYLRGRSVSFVKNEMKLDLGLRHDYYSYAQFIEDTVAVTRLTQMDKKQYNSFQDITLLAKLSYRFSNRMGLDADLQQIAQGRDVGDYLYDFKLNVSGGDRVGRIILGAYTQNSTPALLYTSWISNHYIWQNVFKNVKTSSLSFNYLNDKANLEFKAEYFLITNYLYFTATDANYTNVVPTQLSSAINLLKVSFAKNFTLGRWHLDNYVVLQKSDYQKTLGTPDLYTYNSLYYNRLMFKVLNTSIGFNVRYNTPYTAPSYAVGLGQFYNGKSITFGSYPVASVFIKATLQRTNLFLQYDYANQGAFSNGYYTVNRYPMPDAMLKFGVHWYFYN